MQQTLSSQLGRPAVWPSEGWKARGDVPGLLQQLVDTSIVLPEDWSSLPAGQREALTRSTDPQALVAGLAEHGLLTEYQAGRVLSGKLFGMTLGNYRILDRLGDGSMGVVFRAEHIRMRRPVAVKVLGPSAHENPSNLSRFLVEIRAVARLQHPNIVTAVDCGEMIGSDSGPSVLHYFVMEYVPGEDLERWVEKQGPMTPAKACGIVYQVACGLEEAHKHQLVHRDIKPSNIRVTLDGQAKLLDFGLALHFRSRLTEHGTVLGTIDYMAPEQARDPSSVDIRADIYALGGVLCWCLTGSTPFRTSKNPAQALAARLSQAPPSLRYKRPELPEELDAIVGRMMAVYPGERYADPRALMRALQAFLQSHSLAQPIHVSSRSDSVPTLSGDAVSSGARVQRILIADDEPHLRSICRYALQSEEFQFGEAANGVLALRAIEAERYDLVLLDIDMPEMKGTEVLRRLRQNPPCPHLKVIMFSGRASGDDMAEMLLAGADDYLTKPFSNFQLQARVRAALRLKNAQERSDLLNRDLLELNSDLEHNLSLRDSDLVDARNSLVLALAKLAEQRDTDTGSHLLRLQRFCRCIGEHASSLPCYADVINVNFIQMLACCAPLHDIGKVGLPDHILLKPGKLTPDERLIMETHTTIGAETLAEVARHHGFARAFLKTAIDIARHHHERWDGTGYPDRLAGEAIPLSARIVALADVYDALRSRRVYKPALSHSAAINIMLESSGQFDPTLLHVFQTCAEKMDRIYSELTS
jgi:response regulator RpfG family c-di-GMP phosphodiesterase